MFTLPHTQNCNTHIYLAFPRKCMGADLKNNYLGMKTRSWHSSIQTTECRQSTQHSVSLYAMKLLAKEVNLEGGGFHASLPAPSNSVSLAHVVPRALVCIGAAPCSSPTPHALPTPHVSPNILTNQSTHNKAVFYHISSQLYIHTGMESINKKRCVYSTSEMPYSRPQYH